MNEDDVTGVVDIRDCNDVCPVKIELEEVERVYDSLSAKIYADMDKQYKEGKISGPSYAETWAKLMSSVIGGALQAVVALQNKETAADRAVKYQQVDSSIIKSENETCIAESTCGLNNAKKLAEDIKNGTEPDGDSLYGDNKAVLKAQKLLYERQKTGFDDNARQKLLDSQISAWSIAWKDGSGITIPCAVTKDGIDTSVANVNEDIGKEAANTTIPTSCEAPVDP